MLAAALCATVLCVLVQQARRVELAESSRSFVDNFLSKSKNTGRSEHAYVKSWVQQVKRGGLFGKLHSYEHKVQHSRKMRKDRALAGITEPMGSHEMLDSLMRTRSRAVGGESSRKGADALQRRTDKQFGANDGGHRHEDFAAYRHHADAVAPKYAGKRTLPVMRAEIPKMDSRVGKLMHELGEARPSRGVGASKRKLRGGHAVALKQQLREVGKGHLSGEEQAVRQEIEAAKRAARHVTPRPFMHRSEAGGRFRGGRIEQQVEQEIAAARAHSKHHVPYGRAVSWAKAGAGVSGGVQGEIDAARKAALLDKQKAKAKHLKAIEAANKREVRVEDAYSLPNGDK